MTILNLFATTPKGLELLLVDELRTLGANDPAEKLAGVTFTGDLELAYKACLWSRLANRILLRLAQLPASSPEELYASVQTIAWHEHIHPSGTLSVNFVTSNSTITHTLFGAQKVKDAIVDQLREKFNTRPNVAREKPDVSVHVYLNRNIATISLDLSGESLHKRGYRLEQGAAPLKENLAAAILLRAGWRKIAEQNQMLLDPMCGSGTFLIEAALMAGNIAPGLLRNYFGFLGWKKHDAKIWNQLLITARQCREKGLSAIPNIIGYDADPNAIKIAFANIERAGLHGKIHVEKKDIAACVPKTSPGLLVVNPPYGERLGEMPELPKLYVTLGERLKKEFSGWQAAVFTGNPELGKLMGIRSRKQYALFNGALACQLLLFDVQSEYFVDRSPEGHNERRIFRAKKFLTEADLNSAQMFANRIRKNFNNLKRWAERETISCYRIYDADLPEYAVAVDFYGENVCVQEYPAPKTVDKNKAEQRIQHILAVLPEALGISPANVFFREHFTQILDVNELYSIQELGTTYCINLRDANLEVGLPLEQRILRAHVQTRVEGKSFLNLFSRSGSMTIHAALGGALTTKSVSEQSIYCDWVRHNLKSNGFVGQIACVNIFEWLLKEKGRYDVIFAELPDGTFHLRQDHPDLVEQICKLLSPQGELYLITRDSKFKLPAKLANEISIEDISQQILPMDFNRRPKAQQCWKLS